MPKGRVSIEWAERAVADLRAIDDYIGAESPAAAGRLVAKDAVRRIASRWMSARHGCRAQTLHGRASDAPAEPIGHVPGSQAQVHEP